VPDAQLLDAAREFARELVERPQPAQRWTKMAINKLIYQQLNTVGDFALTTELLSAGTEDQKEAVAAFFEKRKPRFTGM
jgi:enoyl-CoA hydratase/carnithine racemase